MTNEKLCKIRIGSCDDFIYETFSGKNPLDAKCSVCGGPIAMFNHKGKISIEQILFKGDKMKHFTCANTGDFS